MEKSDFSRSLLEWIAIDADGVDGQQGDILPAGPRRPD